MSNAIFDPVYSNIDNTTLNLTRLARVLKTSPVEIGA